MMLDEEGMAYPCSDDTYPTYSIIESSLAPVFINDEESFCVAEDYIIQYPFVYVKKSRLRLEGEVIANTFLH